MIAGRLRPLVAAVTALAVASPAAAQPAPQRDPLGVGREFGAFVNPDRAAAMIRDCEAQTRTVEGTIAAYQGVLAEHELAKAAHQQRLDALNAAEDAVAEAERQAALARGPEADRIRDLVLEPRRQRYRALADALPAQNIAVEASYERIARSAQTTVATLLSAGLSQRDMAARPEGIIHAQQERCRRMRAWAQLGAGAASRQPAAPPADRGWPGTAIGAWQGRWSCRITTSLGREVVSADLPIYIAAVYQSGLVRVSGAPGAGPAPDRPMFRLDVRPDRPAYGEFEDPDGVGEGGRPSAFVDAAQVTADGHLTLRRRYVQTPGKSEFMACTRVGPL